MKKKSNIIIASVVNIMLFVIAIATIDKIEYKIGVGLVLTISMGIFTYKILEIVGGVLQGERESRSKNTQDINKKFILLSEKIVDVSTLIEKQNIELQSFLEQEVKVSFNNVEKINMAFSKDLQKDIGDLTGDLTKNIREIKTTLKDEVKEVYIEFLSRLNKEIHGVIELDKETVATIERLGDAVENKLNGNINRFIDKQKKLIEDIKINNTNTHNIFKNLETVLNNNNNEIKELTLENNKNIAKSIIAIDKNITTNIKSMEEVLITQNEAFKESFSIKTQRQLKKLQEEVKKVNETMSANINQIAQENSELGNDISKTIQKITVLQGKTLKVMEKNQKEMLALNKEDIELMKEIVN